MFVIRKADVEDVAVRLAIATMHEDSFGPAEDKFTPTYGAWWIAFDGKTEAGFAGIVPSSQSPNAGYLSRAGVLPAFRGQGLQKRLIKKRLAYAKQLGWDFVVTDTRRNPASSNSLISCGFKVFQPGIPWSFTDAIYWKKML